MNLNEILHPEFVKILKRADIQIDDDLMSWYMGDTISDPITSTTSAFVLGYLAGHNAALFRHSDGKTRDLYLRDDSGKFNFKEYMIKALADYNPEPVRKE